eukprot:9133597-Pyramimonas_sp.AAC.1
MTRTDSGSSTLAAASPSRRRRETGGTGWTRSRLQHWRISTALSEIYKLQQDPADLAATPVDVITCLLTFRTTDRRNKTLANNVENTRVCGNTLLSRARATIRAQAPGMPPAVVGSRAADSQHPDEAPTVTPFSDHE